MEEAGGYTPELRKAIFDQGVSDCLFYPNPIRCVYSGWELKFLRNMEGVVPIFFHVYWRLRKRQK